MHVVFYRCKKSFLIIEMKLRHCMTLQKNIEKTILLYISGSQPFLMYSSASPSWYFSFLPYYAKFFKRCFLTTLLAHSGVKHNLSQVL